LDILRRTHHHPRDAQRDDNRQAVRERTRTKEEKTLPKRQKCVSLEG
jgi:hypothetical protein